MTVMMMKSMNNNGTSTKDNSTMNMIYVFIGAHAIMAIWRKYIMKEGAMQKILLSKASRSH
jgi:cytochrome b561